MDDFIEDWQDYVPAALAAIEAKRAFWGKRVDMTVLGEREEGSGVDQINQIADRLAGKVG
jgi:hypothetical protein